MLTHGFLQSLAPMYYRNANCAVVVYDITQAVSKVETIVIQQLTSGIVFIGKGQGMGE